LSTDAFFDKESAGKGIPMNHSLKGAFLSGAVFPGLGQVVLKHYARGIALMLAVSAGLFVIVRTALKQAFAILEKVQWEGGTIDMATISKAAARASTSSNRLTFKFFSFLIVFCWLIGILDAYRMGKKKDLEERSTKQPETKEGRPPFPVRDDR